MEGERCKLYIGGLSMEISESALMEYFSKYCEVTDSLIIAGKELGFVTLVDESMIDQILGEEHVFLGRKVVVDRAWPRNNHFANTERRIFMGGLHSGVTKEECVSRTSRVVLIYGKKDRKPRGFGFITFNSDEAVQRVTAVRFVRLKEKTVEVKRREPRLDYKRKTSTSEISNLHLASPSTYNPVYLSNHVPYSSLFYYPFPPFCALPYSTFPVQYSYYHTYEFGGPSVTPNGDSSASPISIAPSNTGPVSAVPSSPSDAESTVQYKFVVSAEEDSRNGSSTQANTGQNGDDPAKSSKLQVYLRRIGLKMD